MKTTLFATGALALALFITQSDVAATNHPVKKAETKALVKGTTLAVDPAASSLNWTAKKFGGQHNGTVKLAKGTLNLDGTKLTGGNFVMDMTSITKLPPVNLVPSRFRVPFANLTVPLC